MTSDSFKGNLSPSQATGLGVLLLCINLLILGPFALRSAWYGSGDFLGFYAGARLAPQNAEYNVPSVLAVQAESVGEGRPNLLSLRLPFYYELLSPLASLPYGPAHRIWLFLVLGAGAAAIAIYPAPHRSWLFAASLASWPLLYSLVEGQDIAIVAAILAAGLGLRAGGSPFRAGLVLSLLLIKFNVFLALPIVFLIKKEKALLAGGGLGSAALIAWSFALGGWNWPREYWRVISNPLGIADPAIMPNLRGLCFRFPGAAALELVFALLVVIALIFIASRSNFETSLAAGLLSSILISRHCFPADCALLIPSLLEICRGNGWLAGSAAIIALLSPVYVLAMYARAGFIPGLIFVLLLLLLVRRVPSAA